MNNSTSYRVVRKVFFVIKSILYPSFIQLVLNANLDVVCLNWYRELYENFLGQVSISCVIPLTFQTCLHLQLLCQHQNWITVIVDISGFPFVEI